MIRLSMEARYCKFKGKLAYITRLCLKKEKQIQMLNKNYTFLLRPAILPFAENNEKREGKDVNTESVSDDNQRNRTATAQVIVSVEHSIQYVV